MMREERDREEAQGTGYRERREQTERRNRERNKRPIPPSLNLQEVGKGGDETTPTRSAVTADARNTSK